MIKLKNKDSKKNPLGTYIENKGKNNEGRIEQKLQKNKTEEIIDKEGRNDGEKRENPRSAGKSQNVRKEKALSWKSNSSKDPANTQNRENVYREDAEGI